MRSGALLCVAALAVSGCYEDAPGLRLVIKDPGFGARKVELFLATRQAMANGVAANEARAGEAPRHKLRGDSFFLDGVREDIVTPLTELDVVDGQVVWNLTADSEGPAHMKIVIAVAYDEQDNAVAIAKMYDVDVPTNDAVAYVLQLEAATQIAPSDTVQPEGIRVWPWRKTNTGSTAAACLGVEYSDGQNVQRVWLVPEDDPDCDEVEVECDKFFWHADDSAIRNDIEDANCFNSIPLSNPGSTITSCRVGAHPCVDGTPSGYCTPLTGPQYCVANALCNPTLCTADPAACTNAIGSTLAVCSLAVDQAGVQCDGVDGPIEVDLKPLFRDGCTKVEFVPWDVLAGGLTATPTHVENTATFLIENFNPTDCTFKMPMVGSIAPTNTAPSLIALDVTLMTDHVLVPMMLSVERGGCATSASGCMIALSSGEGLDRCQ